MEESPSGRWRTLGKRVCPQGYRGFESHLLRTSTDSVQAEIDEMKKDSNAGLS